MTEARARSFINLREELDRAGFSGEDVSPENVDLVENLFQAVKRLDGEVGHASEQKQSALDDAQKTSEELFKLKREHAKIVRENNELHMQMIREKEKFRQ